MRRTVQIAGQMENLFGTLDENLKLLESALHVTTYLHDNHLAIEGEAAQVDRAVTHSRQVQRSGARRPPHGQRRREGSAARGHRRTQHQAEADPRAGAAGEARACSARSPSRRRAPTSAATWKTSSGTTWSSRVGPGGTGKTYLAVAMAVSALLTKQVNRIILARPAVEAGERLGFLPGTLQQKIDPYMRPLYDAIYDMLDADKLERFVDKGIIEVAPLAFMRGRTLNDSFVILDEAQNTTSEQMKMFLTRLGFNSKAVITGDITQIDLPAGRRSGLVEALEVVGKIEGIGFVYFNERDVVRHNLVQQIIKAYEGFAAMPTAHSARRRRGSRCRRRCESRRYGQDRRLPIVGFELEMIVNCQRRIPLSHDSAGTCSARRCAELAVSPRQRHGAAGERSGDRAAQSRLPRQTRPHRCAVVSGRSRTRLRTSRTRKRVRPQRRTRPGRTLTTSAISPSLPQTARRNARRGSRTLPAELRILILHGMIHLAGYDHETDHGEMDRFERRLRRRMGLR